jgi:putative acyl-CoA dehydrogenase
MRALSRTPETAAALRAEIALAKGAHPALDNWLATPLPPFEEQNARRLTEILAKALAASLLLRFAPPEVGEAYAATRLGDGGGDVLGTLVGEVRCEEILCGA